MAQPNFAAERSPSMPPQAAQMLREALCAQDAGALEQAKQLYNAVLQVAPDNFDALHGLGQISFWRGQLDTALILFQAAVRTDRSRADGYANLGLVQHLLRRFGDALGSYELALCLTPLDAELMNRRGVALLDLGRADEAASTFEHVLERHPDQLDALGNYGNALLKLNRLPEALAAYDRALKRAPDNVQLLTNRAVVLRRLDRPAEALMSAKRALASRPDFAQARFVESLTQLTLGDFAAGWQGYETRWSVGLLANQRRSFLQPLWLGKEPLDGKTILLHAEQGSGDTIQFVRYAPLVAERGATVILEVQPELVRLLSATAGVSSVIARGQRLPAFDCHCPLASLPLACGTELANIPASIPYIAPFEREVVRWRARLPHDKSLVGLVWSGGRWHDNDVNRSMRLATLAPLLDRSDLQFVSLQHEVRDADVPFLDQRADLLAIGHEFANFADTAAAIAALDAVISVDTAVAHLAGAMGKPLFLLLPFAADFRWLRERADSPWYPTARLYRQPQLGDWASIVETLRQDLLRANLSPRAGRLSA